MSLKIIWRQAPLILAALLLVFWVYSAKLGSSVAKPGATIRVAADNSFFSDYGPGKEIAAEFFQSTGVTVEFTPLGDPRLLMLRLQHDANFNVDIVLGLDAMLLIEFEQKHLWLPVAKPQGLLPILDPWLRNDGVPFDWAPLAFITRNPTLLVPGINGKVEDFLSSNVGNHSIIAPNPDTSTPGPYLVWWTWAEAQKGIPNAIEQAWRKVHLLPPDWNSAFELYKGGQGDLFFTYVTSLDYFKTVSDTYAIAFPEGEFPLQVEYATIAKLSRNKEVAQKFINFLMTDLSQNLLRQKNYMLSVTNADDHAVKSFPMNLLSEESLRAFVKVKPEVIRNFLSQGHSWLKGHWMQILGQGFLSTLVAMVLGVLLGLAIGSSAILNGILLTLNFVPPIVLATGLLPVFLDLGLRPGFWMVVLVHALLNVGLVAFLVGQVVRQRWELSGLAFKLMGGGYFRFVKLFIGGERSFLLAVAAVVMFFCLNSYYFATLFGGPEILTLDRWALSQLKQPGGLVAALPIFLLQVIAFGLIAAIPASKHQPATFVISGRNAYRNGVVSWLTGLAFLAICAAVFLSLVQNAMWNGSVLGLLKASIWQTALVGAVVSLGLYFLYFGLYWISLKVFSGRTWALDRVLPIGVIPYTVFGFFISKFFSPTSVTIALLLLYFAPLFWFWFGRELRDQALVAFRQGEQMGATSIKCFTTIVAPLIRPQAALVAAIGGAWAMGDFSFETFFRGSVPSLALRAQEALGVFRVQEFATTSLLLCGCCVLLFMAWRVFAIVAD